VRSGAKRERPFKAGNPASPTFSAHASLYAAIRRPSPDFLVRHSFSDGGTIHYSKFTILLWCLECSRRKKALLPNEAKLFTTKTDRNNLSINNMRIGRFGLAYPNKRVQLPVLLPNIDEKRRFPAPNTLNHTTTCRRTTLETSASFRLQSCLIVPNRASFFVQTAIQHPKPTRRAMGTLEFAPPATPLSIIHYPLFIVHYPLSIISIARWPQFFTIATPPPPRHTFDPLI
jgi:hypothetical protein